MKTNRKEIKWFMSPRDLSKISRKFGSLYIIKKTKYYRM